jgi:TBP-interacting protein
MISSDEFLKLFYKKVGFNLEEKMKKLKMLCSKKPSTNVDIIPNIQGLLRKKREEIGLKKSVFYSSKNGYRYEIGKRRIRRKTLQRIVTANKLKNCLLCSLAFSDVFWDRVKSVKIVKPRESFVYDLCVDDEAPTFIAGFGGVIVHNTALAIAIAKELGRDVPFVPIAASEIYSSEVKKTEFLTQSLRKAIGVRIHEMRKIYEGELKEINIEKESHPYNPYMQIPVSATIKLATKDESKKLTMDQTFAMQLVQQGIETGDIVQIDVDGGRIVKLGKSETALKEKKVDISATQVFPIPKGPVMKEKEFVYVLTLHNLDVASSRGGMDMFSLLFGGRERKEIESEVRQEVDEQVKAMVEDKKAEIIPGVVFIDECSMLDIETFAFLNRAMEQELAPIIIFATNRGLTNVKGTDIRAPHGMPLDLLDRLLIINTKPYEARDIKKIIEIRAEAEKIDLDKEALDYLTEIGSKSSLRYAIQLIAPAYEVAKSMNSKSIKKEHVQVVEKLFVDVKKSVSYLREFEKQFLE